MSKKTILSCIHLYLLYLCTYFTFDSEKWVGLLAIAAIIFGIVLIGNRFKNRAGYLVGAVLMEVFLVLLIRNRAELIMFSVFALIIVIAFTLKAGGEQTPFILQTSLVWLMYILFCYLPIYFTKYEGGGALCILGCIYVFVYIIAMAEDNMENFKKIHSRLDKLPIVQLGKSCFFSLLAVLFWVFLGMMVGRNKALAKYLSDKIGGFFTAIGGTPMKIVPDTSNIMGAGKPDMIIPEANSVPETDMMYDQGYTGSPVFGYILEILLCVLLFVLVLCMVYGIYCYLKKNKTDEGDMIEFINEMDEESKTFSWNIKKVTRLRKTLSANEIIRKLYRKKIKARIGNKIPVWASPKELEVLAQWQETRENGELHRLYEKARYSEGGCDTAEVDKYVKNR